MIWFRLKNVLCFFLLLTTAVSALAQNFESEASSPEEAIQEISRQFKIPPNSKHMARLRQEMMSGNSARWEKEEKESNEKGSSSEPPEREIIKHLRGTKGLSFERELKPPPIREFPEEDLKLLAEKAVEIGDMYTNSVLKGRELEACTEDRIERVSLDINSKELNKIALVNTLFIDAKDVPPNAKAIFGENVDIRSYTNNRNNSAYYSAVGYGVTCLPTRVMVTGKQTMRFMGAPALRNYDDNPNGKGKKVKVSE